MLSLQNLEQYCQILARVECGMGRGKSPICPSPDNYFGSAIRKMATEPGLNPDECKSLVGSTPTASAE